MLLAKCMQCTPVSLNIAMYQCTVMFSDPSQPIRANCAAALPYLAAFLTLYFGGRTIVTVGVEVQQAGASSNPA